MHTYVLVEASEFLDLIAFTNIYIFSEANYFSYIYIIPDICQCQFFQFSVSKMRVKLTSLSLT